MRDWEGYLPPASSRLATVTMDSRLRAPAPAQGKDSGTLPPQNPGAHAGERGTARASLSPACDVSAQEPTRSGAAGEEPGGAAGRG